MDLFGLGKKKKVVGIVMRAEILALESGISIFETLLEYANELKKDEKQVSFALKEIAKKIQNGQKRYEAYKKYLDDDILRLLKTAEEKSIPAGDIFAKYAPVKDIAETQISSIKRGIKTPLVTFAILSLVFSNIVASFSAVNDISTEKLSDFSTFIMNNYLGITGTIFVVFAYLFFFIPHKMPIIKTVFKKLEGLLVLSSTVTLLDIGYGASESIPIIEKIFKLKRKRKDGEDASALARMLKNNNIVTPIESADIKIGISLGEFKRTSERILKSKLEDVEGLSKEVSKVLDTFSILLTAIPILLAMSVFLESMLMITNKIGG